MCSHFAKISPYLYKILLIKYLIKMNIKLFSSWSVMFVELIFSCGLFTRFMVAQHKLDLFLHLRLSNQQIVIFSIKPHIWHAKLNVLDKSVCCGC